MLRGQSVCSEVTPSADRLHQALVSAWYLGFTTGTRVQDKVLEDRMLNSVCAVHKPEIELAFLRRRVR